MATADYFLPIGNSSRASSRVRTTVVRSDRQATSSGPPSADGFDRGKPRHRLRQVRIEQGLSLRSVARHTGRTVRQLKLEEDSDDQLTLAQLYSWQEALGVPLADLLQEPEESLSRPVEERAKMVRVMKTAAALRDATRDRRTERMAQMLCEQLIEIMPELSAVSAWPTHGQRRGPLDIGRLLAGPVSVEVLESRSQD